MLKDDYDPKSDENGKPPKFFQIQHFLNFLWNFPRWTLEDLIKKYRKPTQKEVSLKLENELLKAQLEYCKMFLEPNETKEKVEKELNK